MAMKYSILRGIPRKGKPTLKFYMKDEFGRIVFGYGTFRRLTRRLRRAGLTYKPIYHMPKDKYPNATHFSEHFSRAEFACKDPQRTPVPKHLEKNAVRLARALEMLRALMDQPVPLLSVYRTEAWNKHVNGARYSQHKQATAADIANRPEDQDRWVAAAKKVPAIKGIGVYPAGGVHVDVRTGPRVTWSSYVGYR